MTRRETTMGSGLVCGRRPAGALTGGARGLSAAWAVLALVVCAPAARAQSLVQNGDFTIDMTGWQAGFVSPAAGTAGVVGGEACIDILSGGLLPTDVEFAQEGLSLTAGTSYTLSFSAWASYPGSLRAKVGLAVAPYTGYVEQTFSVLTSPTAFTANFTMPTNDPSAGLVFFAGSGLMSPPVIVCIDNVQLVARGGGIAVNQLGYLPGRPKHATVATSATAPFGWELVDAGGGVVASGQSVVLGDDSLSGEHVHDVDFTSFDTPGGGYRIRAGADESAPFSVGDGVVDPLFRDALAYFYHSRSGTPIEMPYAGNDQWTRPAGHLADANAPCALDAGCSYALDVSGGWYDAGDHGKYAVTGGVSVWALLNLYERAVHLRGTQNRYADGTLNLPESGNALPDLLDEARWELEFLMKMQVPAGEPLAGMVHHKVHGTIWTTVPIAPHEDTTVRELRPPSTAATLNLAAVAAQCARVYGTLNSALSARCLDAAERAWQAALANPDRLAPDSDTNGGGAYGDADVSDEFYWAAAELFVTTGESAYRDRALQSGHWLEAPPISWPSTAALGTISLSVVPNASPGGDIAAARAAIVGAADQHVAATAQSAYGAPLGTYYWGSNSDVLNALLQAALAYDFTGADVYARTVVEGMDYLLGRNPLLYSYVTGHGAASPSHPHHRFWANEPPSYPPPPPGVLVGGPNSSLEDPVSQSQLLGCAPQTCWLDDRDAFSLNEVAINWNAPLVWVSAWLAENPVGAVASPGDGGVLPGSGGTGSGAGGAGNSGGSTAGDGSPSGAGAEGSGDSGVNGAAPGGSDDGGCGCDIAAERGTRSWLFGMAIALIAAIYRRRSL